jgi:hypothetical protein
VGFNSGLKGLIYNLKYSSSNYYVISDAVCYTVAGIAQLI